MNKLSLDWENCFGIKKLKKDFKFDKSHIQLIYAPNGTMKTSFANTMKYIETGKNKPIDRLNGSLISKFDVKIDGNDISPQILYVINGDKDIDSAESFVNFLASKELQSKYKDIYDKIVKEKNALMSKLKLVTQSSDCENELLETFSYNGKGNIFDILDNIYSQLTDLLPHYEFKYNDVFDKKGAVKVFLEKHKDNLQSYIEKYDELLSHSTFYQKKNGHSFGTFQASQLCGSVEDESFFAVDHKIVLSNQEIISSTIALKNKIRDEQDKILSDNNLRKIFDKITKEIDKNADLRGFKSVIENHPDWIKEIINYDDFKKNVWLGHLSCNDVKPFFDEYKNAFDTNKSDLQNIIKEAGKQQNKWKDMIELYKSRFHVPFNVSIMNQEDIILHSKAAKLKFTYYDENNNPIDTEKDTLDLILSRGEKRAFIILQFIFDMESRKSTNQETLLVMDDISESFDYQNKYAIIEYIKDLSLENNFYFLILTHNYDFYRTVSSRLGVRGDNLWLVEKDTQRYINFNKGEYTGNVFVNAFVGHDDDDKIFISMLPFVRNLIEYTEGESSDYFKLTSCLHHKKDTKSITIKDVADIMEKFTQNKGINHNKTSEKFYNLVMLTAEKINLEPNLNSVKIENKIVLSIAIRLLAEQYMYDAMIKAGKNESDFQTSSSQTGYWTQKYKEFCPTDTNRVVIEEVNMMTPELIHLNSFMYEPLIDMSVTHLKDLYSKCKSLSV